MTRGRGGQRIYSPSERDREKQAVRERDSERLRRGEPPADDPFAGIPIAEFRIVSIGGRPIGRRKADDDRRKR